jgi:uncharacterized protein
MEVTMKVQLRSCVMVLALSPLLAGAQQQAADPQQQRVVSSEAYRMDHPGEQARKEGLDAMEDGHPEAARRQFPIGARYADKLSQYMLGQLYWEGVGGEVDRPLAYAWMDLAAERGSRSALARREYFWEALNAQERERAIQVGRPLYERYGDEVAKPRQEAVMRRARKNVTGSRTGWVGTVKGCVGEEQKAFTRTVDGLPCATTLSGETYYGDAMWEPKQYWQRQDAQMEKDLKPKVDVGTPQEVAMPKTPGG